MKFSRPGILQFLNVIHSGELFEVRVVGKTTYSGYYTDAVQCVNDLADLQADGNICFTLQGITAACLDREQHDKILPAGTQMKTTVVGDVINYHWLPVFIERDPADGDSDAIFVTASHIYDYLHAQGFSAPVVLKYTDSVLMLYRVNFLNNSAARSIVKRFLQAIGVVFSGTGARVNADVFHPARVVKMPEKLNVPPVIGDVDFSRIKYICEQLVPECDSPQMYNNYDPDAFSAGDWLDRHGIKYTRQAYGTATKYILNVCPFDENHTNDSAVIEYPNGSKIFHCFHNGCCGKTWNDLRLKFEPTPAERADLERRAQAMKPNRYETYENALEPAQVEEWPADRKVWQSPKDVRKKPRQARKCVPTGIAELDRQTFGGLKKGTVTLLTGLPGHGKSTLLSQMILAAVDNNMTCGLFTGELRDYDAMDWISLQAAGADVRTLQSGYHDVDAETDRQIMEWLDGKLFIYDNDFGMDINKIIAQAELLVREKKLDLLVLDNLMIMDSSSITDGRSENEYTVQEKLVKKLSEISKRYNVHTILVAHPRKVNTFLRAEDISGSGKMFALADACIMIHRMTEDTKYRIGQMFYWRAEDSYDAAGNLVKEADPRMKCDNLIEVAKNRQDGRTLGLFVPMYFDTASLRLKNHPNEARVYGWKNDDTHTGYLFSNGNGGNV